MRPGTLLRLALAGSRTDTARVALTALSAALATVAVLSALTVLAIRSARQPAACDTAVDTGRVDCADGYASQYTNALLVEPGLRPGVVFALVLLCIPVLALAGQCARLGAPARDRRLAAIRLAGAGPRQAIAVAAAETALASALGAALGMLAYLAGRAVLHRPDELDRLPLPTDVRLAPWLLASVVAGLPLLATGAAALLLRRVSVTPFGVVRRQRTRAPRPWPAVLIVPGVAAFAAIEPLARYLERSGRQLPEAAFAAMLFGGALLTTVGVVLGTGWISHRVGRLLQRVARRPAPLLAARQLLADPWSGSRTFAALLACVLFGAGAAGMRAWFATDFAVREETFRASAAASGREYVEDPDRYAFYFRTLDLVDSAVTVALVIAAAGLLVVLVEGIVSRRRAYASLVATGVPRAILARAVVWRQLAPVVPAMLVALAAGVALPRAFATEVDGGGYSSRRCDAPDPSACSDPESPYWYTVEIAEIVRPVPVPVGDLAVVGGAALVAVLAVVGIGLLFLRASTEVTELRTT